jgi:hypothetical protein
MKANWQFIIKTGLSIALFSWLIYTTYWFFKSLNWWPLSTWVDFVLGSVGTIGLAFRIGAVLSAILTLVYFWQRKGTSKVTKTLRFALLLEAPYFMGFIPSAVFGFVAGFGFASGFHTLNQGGIWFIFETAIPTLVQSIIVPVSLLKLRSKLNAEPLSEQEITKWACITGISYMIVFWVTYFTQWIATFLQPASYASDYPGYGIKYLLNFPINIFTFTLTAVGLPLLIVFFWWTSQPAIKDPTKELNLRNIGIVLTLLGGYFITIIAVFFIFRYVGGP